IRTTTTGRQKRYKWTELELNYLEHEMEECKLTTMNYFNDLADNAKSFEIFFNYVRKRKGGAVLLNKQLLEEWSLRY
ncbi:12710_t:CDS:2, partial [Gigaspora rosea]